MVAGAVLLAIVYIAYVGLAVAGGTGLAPALGQAATETIAYVRNLLTGDLGMSTAATSTRNPIAVSAVVGTLMLRSLGLLGLALTLAIMLGVPLGIAAARRRHHAGADLLLLLSIVGVSAPSFFVALLLQQAAIRWTHITGKSLLPVGGFGWDAHIWLPALVLAARPLAQITRMTFISVSEVLAQDYIRTARGKGLQDSVTLVRHVLRNAAPPILTTAGVSLRFALSSLPVVELFFGWPGAGYMLIKGIAAGDAPLTVTLLVCFGIVFLTLNLALDLGYRLLDPRLRTAQSTMVRRTQRTRFRATVPEWLRNLFAGDRWRARGAALREWLRPASWRTSWAALVAPGRARAGHLRTGMGMLVMGGLLLTLLFGVVVLGPTIAPHSPFTTQGMEFVDGQFLIPPFAPDAEYPWGTDVLGRDMMSLVLAGARQTLTLALLAVAARMVLGIVLGTLAGWNQGQSIDRVILGAAEVLSAFPTLILAMLLILALGIRNGYRPFLIGLSVVGWGEVMQYVRGQVIAMRPRAFVESAYATGAGTSRIVARHLIPNLAPALISLAALEMGAVLMLLGELGFIGIFIGGGAFAELVVDGQRYHYSDVPEWGALLSNVRLYARTYLWTALYPALAFFVAILGFNLLGEGLHRRVDAGGMRFNRLANRYVLLALTVAIWLGVWVSANSGGAAYLRAQARQFDATHALALIDELAAPTFDGRALGTPGQTAAAQRIADEFAALGLQRGANESYFQARPREFEQLDAVPVLELDDGAPLVYRQDYAEFAGPFRIEGDVTAPVQLLAAGDLTGSRSGLSSQLPRPLRDLDLADTILLVLNDADVGRFARLPYRGILVATETSADLARIATLSAKDPEWRNFGGRAVGQNAPVLAISDAVADRLLAPLGVTTQQMRREANQLLPDAVLSRATGRTVHMTVQGTVHTDAEVFHVLGHLPAVEAQSLGGQMIVVLAQYDMPPPSPDGVFYSGANDNASGVALMLEVIRTMQETGYRPYKTFLFVAYAGEGTENGNRVNPLAVEDYLEAKLGFAGNFNIEAIVELRGVGGNGDPADHGRLAVESSGSLRLANHFVAGAKRVGAPVVRTGTPLDITVVFDQNDGAGAGQEAPTVGIRWEGWQTTARTPADTVARIDTTALEQAGRAVSLGLMILGRDTDY